MSQSKHQRSIFSGDSLKKILFHTPGAFDLLSKSRAAYIDIHYNKENENIFVYTSPKVCNGLNGRLVELEKLLFNQSFKNSGTATIKVSKMLGRKSFFCDQDSVFKQEDILSGNKIKNILFSSIGAFDELLKISRKFESREKYLHFHYDKDVDRTFVFISPYEAHYGDSTKDTFSVQSLEKYIPHGFSNSGIITIKLSKMLGRRSFFCDQKQKEETSSNQHTEVERLLRIDSSISNRLMLNKIINDSGKECDWEYLHHQHGRGYEYIYTTKAFEKEPSFKSCRFSKTKGNNAISIKKIFHLKYNVVPLVTNETEVIFSDHIQKQHKKISDNQLSTEKAIIENLFNSESGWYYINGLYNHGYRYLSITGKAMKTLNFEDCEPVLEDKGRTISLENLKKKRRGFKAETGVEIQNMQKSFEKPGFLEDIHIGNKKPENNQNLGIMMKNFMKEAFIKNKKDVFDSKTSYEKEIIESILGSKESLTYIKWLVLKGYKYLIITERAKNTLSLKDCDFNGTTVHGQGIPLNKILLLEEIMPYCDIIDEENMDKTLGRNKEFQSSTVDQALDEESVGYISSQGMGKTLVNKKDEQMHQKISSEGEVSFKLEKREAIGEIKMKDGMVTSVDLAEPIPVEVLINALKNMSK